MDNNFLTDALNLTMFGMGFVFVFLALMVFVTNLMSVLILKIQPAISLTPSMDTESTVVIDEKTRTIIEAAIKMHLKR